MQWQIDITELRSKIDGLNDFSARTFFFTDRNMYMGKHQLYKHFMFWYKLSTCSFHPPKSVTACSFNLIIYFFTGRFFHKLNHSLRLTLFALPVFVLSVFFSLSVELVMRAMIFNLVSFCQSKNAFHVLKASRSFKKSRVVGRERVRLRVWVERSRSEKVEWGSTGAGGKRQS